jgi:hypothetical protein
MEPINPPFGVMEERISRTAVSEELSRIKLFDLPALLSTQLAGPATTAFVAGDGPVNSEKRPLLELLAPVSFFTHARVAFTNIVDRRFDADDTTLLLSGHRSRLEFQNLLNIARFQSNVAVDDYRLTYVAVQECLKLRPEDVESLTILAGVTKAMNATVERLGTLERLIRLRPDAPQLILTYATEFSAWRSSRAPGAERAPLDEPIRLLLRGVKLTEGKDERYIIRLAELLAADGRPAEAAAGYAAALALRDTYEPMEESLGDDDLASLAARNYLEAHDRSSSERLLERLKTLNPQHAELPSLARKLAAEKKGS